MSLLARTRAHAAPLAAALLAAAIAVVLAGCSAYPSVQEARSQGSSADTASLGLVSPGTLTVGVDADDAPYCWVTDESTGTMAGFDIEVAAVLADQMGLKVSFVNVAGDVSAVSAGACDVVMGASSQYAASDPSLSLTSGYAQTAPALFALAGIATPDAATMGGVTVGAQADSVSSYALAAAAPSATIRSYPSLGDAFDALRAGEVNYVACDSFLGGYILEGSDEVELVALLQRPEERGIAVSGANAALTAAVGSALSQISSNGVLSSVSVGYVGGLGQVGGIAVLTGAAAADQGAASADPAAAAPVAEEPAVDQEAVPEDAAAEETAPEEDVAAEEDVADEADVAA